MSAYTRVVNVFVIHPMSKKGASIDRYIIIFRNIPIARYLYFTRIYKPYYDGGLRLVDHIL